MVIVEKASQAGQVKLTVCDCSKHALKRFHFRLMKSVSGLESLIITEREHFVSLLRFFRV